MSSGSVVYVFESVRGIDDLRLMQEALESGAVVCVQEGPGNGIAGTGAHIPGRGFVNAVGPDEAAAMATELEYLDPPRP